MADQYHTVDSIFATVGRLRDAVDETRAGVRSPTPPSSGQLPEFIEPSDADAIVASLEQAVHGSVFAEVLQDEQIRLQIVETIRAVLIRQVEHSFMHRVDPQGNPWAPLKQPSRATGAMQRQAIESIRQGSVTSDGFRSADGLQVFYWRYQNYGTSRIPARPFWAVSAEVVQIVDDFIVEASVKRLSQNISEEMGGFPWE